MRDRPAERQREIAGEHGGRHVGGRRNQRGEIRSELMRDVVVDRRIAERGAYADHEQHAPRMIDQQAHRDPPMPRAEQRKHDQTDRRKHRTRDDRIGDHHAERAAERIGHRAHEQQRREKGDDPRSDAAQREDQQFARGGIRVEPHEDAEAPVQPVLHVDQRAGAGAPAGQHGNHRKDDAAEALLPLARNDRVELVAGRVEAAAPIAHRRAALMHVGFERRDARRDRAEQAGTRLRGRGRRDVLRDVAQLFELGDERGALPVVVERGDHAVERARQFRLARGRRRGGRFRRRGARGGGGRRRRRRRAIDQALQCRNDRRTVAAPAACAVAGIHPIPRISARQTVAAHAPNHAAT